MLLVLFFAHPVIIQDWIWLFLPLVIPPMRSTVKQRRNGMDVAVPMYLDAEMSAEPMPDDCERIVVLRLWAANQSGGVTG